MYTFFTRRFPKQAPSNIFVRQRNRLVNYDPNTNLMLIEHDRNRLVVDCTLLSQVKFRPKTLLQFIGEAEAWKVNKILMIEICRLYDSHLCAYSQPPQSIAFQIPNLQSPLILRARIVRNINGLDLGLYDEVLQIRRQFEAERSELNF